MVKKPFIQKQFSSIAGVHEEMMDGEEYSINFKRKMLKIIKDLTNNGKHKEANDLYQKYFGGLNGKN